MNRIESFIHNNRFWIVKYISGIMVFVLLYFAPHESNIVTIVRDLLLVIFSGMWTATYLYFAIQKKLESNMNELIIEIQERLFSNDSDTEQE